MTSLDMIESTLLEHAAYRFSYFAPSPMYNLIAQSPEFRQISQALIDFLMADAVDIERWYQLRYDKDRDRLEKFLADFFMSHTIDYFYQHNQYLQIKPVHQAQLMAIYREFFERFRLVLPYCANQQELTRQLDQFLRHHQANLARFTHMLATANGGLDFTLFEPVCSTYSPELQLDLLHIQADSLLEPILDLGCGESADLVHALRTQGKVVYGIDRLAKNGDYLSRSDWFDYPIQARQWGTIISHMAFSTHFLHHHLREDGNPSAYARCYMSILDALKIGGRFIYTPGLPFIETLLPQQSYHIETHPLSDQAITPLDSLLYEQIGQSVAYSTTVIRML